MTIEADDLSWLDDDLRRRAAEMMRVLFQSSRISVITFDAAGAVVGVNPQTASFGAGGAARYHGVQLLEHPILRRLGWAGELRRVLEGHTVELTDTRWITLFSGEERYIDVLAGPVIIDGTITGGVVYLMDATAKHRALLAEAAQRGRARELEVFLARDMARQATALRAWSLATTSSPAATAGARGLATELTGMLDDLLQFVQLGTYQPRIERLAVLEALRAAGITQRPRASNGTDAKLDVLAVSADARLLRHVLRNLALFSRRTGGGEWCMATNDGRVTLGLPSALSSPLLTELLATPALSAIEADSADASLAAARWMVEMMGGTMKVNTAPPGLIVELAAAA